MRAVVVFESVYGDTHRVADAIGAGLGVSMDVEVVKVDDAGPERVASADLLVVGGPTHAHGMSWSATRHAAVADEQDKAASAEHPGEDSHALDEAATGEGLRTWFHHLARPGSERAAAAFDTRIDRSVALVGSAARGIAHRLHHNGFELADEPMSFFVEDTEGPMAEGELDRAEEWGRKLAWQLAPAS